MKKTILFAALAALGLAGCQAMYRNFGGASAPSFDPTNPQVYVVPAGNNKAAIVVDQEPIYFVFDKNQKQIRWHLATPGYRFVGNNGISGFTVIKGSGNPATEFVCGGSGVDFNCTYMNSVQGRYKYTINVEPLPQSGNPTPPALDPSVGND